MVIDELPVALILYALRRLLGERPAGPGFWCGQPLGSTITRPWHCTPSATTGHVAAFGAAAISCSVICTSGAVSFVAHAAAATAANTKGSTCAAGRAK